MDKLNFESKVKDEIQNVKQTQAESQRVFVGQIRPKPNHILFEFDLVKKEVRRATFTKKDVDYVAATRGQVSKGKVVDVKKDCIYISAMNEKNAWKKFDKYIKNGKTN